MDIVAYSDMLDGLIEYNKTVKNNYGNKIVRYPTTDTTYPHTVFQEIRNVANANYNTCYERVSSVGYRVDIFAKTKAKIGKDEIARNIAKLCDDYLTAIGLTRVSFNINDLENDSSIFHIIMTYSGQLNEYRRKLF